MGNNIVKLGDLEKDVVYKDDEGRLFKIFREEYPENPRNLDNIFTFFTWEKGNKSPDKANMTFPEFAEAHGVNTQKEWSFSTVINKMNRDGYFALPIYGLYEGTYYSLDNDLLNPWNRHRVGIAFVKRDKPYLKRTGDKELKAIAEKEMKEYNAWCLGDVWGITLLSSPNKRLESSSGHFATKDWVSLLKEMMLDVGVLIQDEYEVAKEETK